MRPRLLIFVAQPKLRALLVVLISAECQGTIIIRRTCEHDIMPIAEGCIEKVGEDGRGKDEGYGEVHFFWSGLM